MYHYPGDNFDWFNSTETTTRCGVPVTKTENGWRSKDSNEEYKFGCVCCLQCRDCRVALGFSPERKTVTY